MSAPTIPRKYDIERLVLAAARRRLQELADDYRKTVLVPFCRKYRLTFLSGMGRTVFYTEDNRNFGSADAAVDEGYHEAVRIFRVLDQEAIGRNDEFGFYVCDVTAQDLELHG